MYNNNLLSSAIGCYFYINVSEAIHPGNFYWTFEISWLNTRNQTIQTLCCICWKLLPNPSEIQAFKEWIISLLAFAGSTERGS